MSTNNIATSNYRRYLSSDGHRFETFVIELLSVHLQNQGKRLETVNADFYDCLAPDGFDDFAGPVFIEISVSLTQTRFKKCLNAFAALSTGETLPSNTRRPTLLVISEDAESEVARFREASVTMNLFEGFRIVFWSRRDLELMVERYAAAADSISQNIIRLQFNNVREHSGAWRQTRASRLASLSARYTTGPFSLFLGAGVSASAGMPDWNTLLNALFITYLSGGTQQQNVIGEETIVKLVQRMSEIDNHSALVTARYLRSAICRDSEDGRVFVSAIRQALYGLRRKNTATSSRLIQVLARLCMPRRTGALVKAVVTYNFDDLFERELAAKAISHKCLYTENTNFDVNDLPVYHVHGFIPEKAGPADGSDDATLVFAEEGYHQIYTDAYHWSNLVQLGALRDSTCLMVGLSMSDPNLRRLLEIAKRGANERGHFAFMKRTKLDDFAHKKDQKGKSIQLFENLREAASFLESHHALTEVLMRELGVTVIWYEYYDEITDLLEGMGFPAQSQALSVA